jgi:hypothetical protein
MHVENKRFLGRLKSARAFLASPDGTRVLIAGGLVIAVLTFAFSIFVLLRTMGIDRGFGVQQITQLSCQITPQIQTDANSDKYGFLFTLRNDGSSTVVIPYDEPYSPAQYLTIYIRDLEATQYVSADFSESRSIVFGMSTSTLTLKPGEEYSTNVPIEYLVEEFRSKLPDATEAEVFCRYVYPDASICSPSVRITLVEANRKEDRRPPGR